MIKQAPLSRVIFFILSFAGILFVIGFLFWKQEVQYLTPTEKPLGYVDVRTMEDTNLDSVLRSHNGKPVFIHYYNPYCPCSKFNYNYYEELVEKYEGQFNMYFVIREMDRDVVDEIKNNITVDVTLVIDENGEIAKQTGVYSTPQGVILDSDYNLYFRGNYNRSRYCTIKTYNYVEMAMDSILNNRPPPQFDYFATTAYGCSIEKEKEFYQTLLNY